MKFTEYLLTLVYIPNIIMISHRKFWRHYELYKFGDHTTKLKQKTWRKHFKT